jgi:hypothetical protein
VQKTRKRINRKKVSVVAVVIAILVLSAVLYVVLRSSPYDPLKIFNVQFGENPKTITFSVTNIGSAESNITRIDINDQTFLRPNDVLQPNETRNYTFNYEWILGFNYMLSVYSSTGEVFRLIQPVLPAPEPEPEPSGNLTPIKVEWYNDTCTLINGEWINETAHIFVVGNASITGVSVNGAHVQSYSLSHNNETTIIEVLPFKCSAPPDYTAKLLKYQLGNAYSFTVFYVGGNATITAIYGGD